MSAAFDFEAAAELYEAKAGLPQVAGLDWKEPADLWARYDPPALSPDLLPPVLEQYARSQAAITGADPAGFAMAALAVCSAALPDGIRVRVKRHDVWEEPARLWVALVGPPSTKKSPLLTSATRPLRAIDTALFREYEVRQEEYDALDAKLKKNSPRPKQRRLLISDCTIEAAQEVLKDSPDGVLSVQDELSGWFGAMDKYNAGRGAMADRGFWLQAFNGGPYACNRVSRGPALIPNLSVSLLGGIQPELLRRIVADSQDDGLLQRLLPVVLRPATVGVDAPTGRAVVNYDGLVRSLNVTPPPTDALVFDDAAQEVRAALEERHHKLMAAEIISPKLASHFGKLDGIFARLCVLFHAVEAMPGPLPAAISGETAGRVQAFMERFLLPMSLAFYTGTLGFADDHATLIELASFILANGLDTVQHRDTQRASRSLKALTADQSRRLFERLEALGWLEPTEPPPTSKTPRWAVNPLTADLFAERGRIEKGRRDAARADLAAVFERAA